MYVHMTSFKPCLCHKRCCSNVKKSLLYHNVTLVAHSSRDDGRLQRERGHSEKLPYVRRKLCFRPPPRWGTTVDSHSLLSRFAPLYACHAGWADRDEQVLSQASFAMDEGSLGDV